MPSCVIVGIPAQQDPVWQISSEEVPHITLLFLGDAATVQDPMAIAEFVEHASDTSLTPFYLDVDYRGTLGDDEADVIFFRDNWGFEDVAAFREQLLQNKAIRRAFNAAEQFDTFTPHLTLGYPAMPAKNPFPDRSIYSVNFDRIAIWFGDSSGPEFRLQYPERADGVLAMGIRDAEQIHHVGAKNSSWDIVRSKPKLGEVPSKRTKTKSPKRFDKSSLSVESIETLSQGERFIDTLMHYGVKGMKWGVRRHEDAGGTDGATGRGKPGGSSSAKDKAINPLERIRAARDKSSGPSTKVTATKTISPKSGKAVVKTAGGERQPAHPDAVKAATTKQQLEKSGVKSLSNNELQQLAARLDLEQRIDRLAPPKQSAGKKLISRILKDTGEQQLKRVVNQQVTKQLDDLVKKQAA